MTQFKLGKPPVVESWISFDFEPSPDKIEWNEERPSELVDLLSDRFPHKKYYWHSEIQLNAPEPGQLPVPKVSKHAFDFVRVRNEESTRIFKIADDSIVFNHLKADGDWPGFENLLDESLELLAQYTKFFHPSSIKGAVLHYVDIVDIPVCESGVISLDDYFNLVRELPQRPFGLIASYKTEYVTICPNDDEPLIIALQTMPQSQERGTLRFRLDWNKKCRKIDFSSDDTIREGLRESYAFMKQCFRASFTEKGFELFDPEDV